MKHTEKRPPFLEIDDISEPKVLPLTTYNMYSSQCFAFPPVTTDIEYVPFERVYYENQPVKTIQYVSVAKKVIDYMPIERKRPCHSPGKTQQYSITPMDRSAVLFQSNYYQNRGNSPLNTPQNLSVYIGNSPLKTQENRMVFMRNSPLNIPQNQIIYRNSPLNRLENRGIYVNNRQRVGQNIFADDRNDMAKKQQFLNEKSGEFKAKEEEFALNEENIEKIIVEMQKQEEKIKENDLLLPGIVKKELVCLEGFVSDIVHTFDVENERKINEGIEIKEQVEVIKEEKLLENDKKDEENQENQLEISRNKLGNYENEVEKLLKTNEINENYLLELKNSQNEAYFPNKTPQEPQISLRLSQGFF